MKKRVLQMLAGITLILVANQLPAQGWYDLNWNLRKSHVISGSSGAGTNYQVRIMAHKATGTDTGPDVYLGTGTNVRDDFGDVRFTSSDGMTLLDYWIETGSLVSATQATFWVEVSADLGSAQTIYVYYGNTAATTTNSGVNTFILFDDFTGSSLDGTKWTKINGGTPSFGSGLMTISSTTDPGKVIATGGPTTDNNAIVARFQVTGGTSGDERAGVGVRTGTGDGRGYNFLFRGFTTLNTIQFLDDGAVWGNTVSFTWLKNTFYIMEAFHTGTILYGRPNYGTWSSQSGWTTRSGYLALNFGSYTGATTVWDWAFIRKCITTEPAHSTWGAQQSAPAVYYWTHGTSTDWQVLTNWTPTRTNPASDDILIFNNGGIVTATNVPNQTISELILSNSSTEVYLQPASSPNTLTINGYLATEVSNQVLHLGPGIILAGTLSNINNNGTIETQNTNSSPIPAGKTWGGTVEYDAALGGQTVVAGTYNNLKISYMVGTETASGNITVNGSFDLTPDGILNMGTYQLLGAMTTVTNNGTIRTQNTSAAPIPTGKTWGGIVQYDGAGQTISSGTYHNLTLGGSGTKTTTGVTVNNLLSMEGTAVASVTPTYGLTATLQYTTTAAHAAGAEWLTPFAASGGVIIKNTGAITMNGAKTFNSGIDLTIAPGATLNTGNNALTLAGDLINSGTFVPGTGTVTFNDVATQNILGSSVSTFYNLTLNNYSGLMVQNGAVVNGTLTFTAGKITTGSLTKITLASGATITNAGASRYVYGNVEWNVANGTSTKNFFVGDATYYTPVSVTFNGVTTPGTLTVKTTAGDHPNIAGSGVAAGRSVNRYWTMTKNVALVVPNYNVTFTFDPGDIDPGAIYTNFLLKRYTSPTWFATGAATNTATTTTVSGLTAFSDFQVGEASGLFYESIASGNWSDNTKWRSSPDQSTWTSPATTYPTNAATLITIKNGHTITVNAASTASSLIIDPGGILAGSSYILSVRYDWANNGTFNANTGTIVFNGGAQTISGSTSTTFNSMTINNTVGITLNSNITVSGTLTFTQGIITTGANKVTLGSTATASGAHGDLPNDSFVNGNFEWTIPTGNPLTRTFPVGDATTYTPVTLSGLNITVAGTLTAKNTFGEHPNISTSTIDPYQDVNRYWTLTAGGGLTTPGTYSATFYYRGKRSLVDVDPLADLNAFIVRKWNGSAWSGTTKGSNTDTSQTVSGISGFSDFAVGDGCTTPSNPTSATATPSSTICTDGYAILTLSGGGGGAGGTAQMVKWYTGSCGGTPVGTGNKLEVRPTVNTTYYGRYESGPPCNVVSAGCASVTVTVTGNTAPAITYTTNYCLGNGQTQVDITSAYSSLVWNTGSTADPYTAPQAGIYTVTVTASNGCTNRKEINIGNELIADGDFSEGKGGFTSSYIYTSSSPMMPEGLYSVVANAQTIHPVFFGTDHTNPGTDLFMTVNGNISAGINIWEETITVTPNTKYYFNAWAMSMNQVGNEALLQFSINDELLGTPFQLPPGAASAAGPFVWLRFYSEWTSGPSVTTAHIKIVDLQTALSGNDFGLDDISFSTQSPNTINIAPTSSFSCETGSVNLFSNATGGAGSYTYSWTGPGGYTSSAQNPVLDLSTADIGTYSLIASDAQSCPSLPGNVNVTFNRWRGASTGDWKLATNWDLGQAPSCITPMDAIIPTGNNVVINDEGMTAYNLIIGDGASLTINPGKSLRVCGCATLKGPHALVVKSNPTGNARFLNEQPVNYLNGGSADVQLYLSKPDTVVGHPCRGCWHYVSPPVSGATANVFIGDYLQSWTENFSGSNGWSGYIIEPSYPLSVMQGYAVSRPGTANPVPHFTGQINEPSQSKSLTRTVNKGWGYNLVGNPYTTYLDIKSSGITWTNVDRIVWYYSQLKGNYNIYMVSGSSTGTQYAPAMQGFFVHVTEPQISGSLTFGGSARTLSYDTTFYKDGRTDELRITVQKDGDFFYDEAIVNFIPDATAAYDQDLDGSKMWGNEEAPQLYTISTDNFYLTVNSMDYPGVNTIIPLNMEVQTNGTGSYQMVFSGMETFRPGITIFLEDKKLNVTQELMTNPNYPFIYTSGDTPQRFLLHFHNPFYGTEESGKNTGIQIYTFGEDLYLNDLTGKAGGGELFIYNMIGQQIAQRTVTASTLNKYTFNFPNGYYVVRVITKDKTYTGKVYLD